MRAGRFKVGVVAVVLALVVAGYLVSRSATEGGEESAGHSVVGRGSLVSLVETIREALSGAGRVTTLKVARCPTQAVGGGYVHPPSQVRVWMPVSSSSHLVAYATANGTLLPAPARWECTASIGSDGSEEVGAGPIGSVMTKKPGSFAELRHSGPAVRATLIPGCEGCIATVICSFFPHSGIVKVYESSFPCEGRPRGELRFRLSRSTFAFVDPPEVRGSAIGSGGSLPSVGILSFSPAAGVHQLSCTLAVSEMNVCAQSVAAFMAFENKR